MRDREEEMAGIDRAASNALCDHIRKQGFEGHLFSDIIISFLSKEYPLHKLVLSQNPYFFSLLSEPWKENGMRKLQIQIDDPNATIQGLEIALAYLYGKAPLLTEQNVVSVVAWGCFLCLDNLVELCAQFIVQDLRVDTFITYQQLSERHFDGGHGNTVPDACRSFLCSHAARELQHLLPKLSLQVLCQLLRSDEMWVPNELERHKLAIQALIDWKLDRLKVINTPDSVTSKKHKSKSVSVHKSVRIKSLRCNRFSSKIRSSKRKGSPVFANEISLPPQKEVDSETDLQKLRRLWEDTAAESSYGSRKDLDMCIGLFTRGGIIYAHMEVDELRLVKRKLEDANLPSGAINDSIRQKDLLEDVVRRGDNHSRAASCDDDEDDDDDDEDLEMDDDEDDDDDDEDLEMDDDEDDDDDDEDDDEDEVDYDEEEESSDTMDSKRWETTSGLSWAAKLDTGMRLKDFPPFRFGVEFFWKDNKWNLDPKYKSLFYGGSLWSISVTKNVVSGWQLGVNCYSRKNAFDSHPYSDNRKKVQFMARIFIKTSSGLQCVKGTGLRNDTRHPVEMHLNPKDIVQGESLRISAAVQLTGD